MRHNKKGRKLGTDWSHTKAMKRSLVIALFLNDRIKTVESRAKEIRPDVDKIITWAKRGDLHSRRLAIAYLNDKELVREIFEKVSRKGDNAPMVILELVTEPGAGKKAAAAPAKKKATPKKVAAKKSEQVAEDLGFEEDGTKEQLEAVDAAEEAKAETAEEFREAVEASSEAEAGKEAAEEAEAAAAKEAETVDAEKIEEEKADVKGE